jgi:hypothetical protein
MAVNRRTGSVSRRAALAVPVTFENRPGQIVERLRRPPGSADATRQLTRPVRQLLFEPGQSVVRDLAVLDPELGEDVAHRNLLVLQGIRDCAPA